MLHLVSLIIIIVVISLLLLPSSDAVSFSHAVAKTNNIQSNVSQWFPLLASNSRQERKPDPESRIRDMNADHGKQKERADSMREGGSRLPQWPVSNTTTCLSRLGSLTSRCPE
ncbi:hypothetical protein V8C26DRAFT_400503 [Trichoderma gracile]